MLSLPKSREQFRKIVRRNCVNFSEHPISERVFFLPESIQNSHKVITVSGSLDSVLPERIEPFNEVSEKELVSVLMNEIQGNIAVEIDCNPSLDRCSGDTVFYSQKNPTGRIFAIGASHVTRLVGGLA
jgi:hypothetical protein